jgi:DNA-directed RNA polymerase subunit E'/Rpb7
METVIIRKHIILEPMYLNSNIMNNLLEKLKILTDNECSKDIGYIIKINNIKNIISNSISTANSDIIFNIEYEALVLKPEVDKVYEGTVMGILSNGILIDILNKLKIFIPQTNLNEFTINNNILIFSENKEEIKIKDKINVKIKGVKYSNKNFICYGIIIK